LHPATSVAGPGPQFLAVMNSFTQPLSVSEGATRAVAFGSGAHSAAGTSAIAANRTDLLPMALLGLWILGTCFLLARWAWHWWRLRRAVRIASPLTLNYDVPVLSTRLHLEPGSSVFCVPSFCCPRVFGDD
jgi:hypothetical protein